MNQFKIGAVGEHVWRFGIRVRDQDPNRSSPQDGSCESPLLFSVNLGNIANIQDELFFDQRRFTPHTDPRTMAQGSRPQVTRISAPDYPLIYLRCLQVAPGKPEENMLRGPFANSPKPCDQHRSRTFASLNMICHPRSNCEPRRSKAPGGCA